VDSGGSKEEQVHKVTSIMLHMFISQRNQYEILIQWCTIVNDSSRQKEIRSHGNVDLERDGENYLGGQNK